MNLNSRLRRLERVPKAVDPDPYANWLTERDWLNLFAAWGERGYFAGEPDFPIALATYRQALEQAEAQTNPPFEPPPEFSPTLERPLRLLNWRHEFHFPALHEARNWLSAMLQRVQKRKPPVTEQEYRELEAWFEAHQDWLHRQEVQGLLDLGNGQKTTTANIRYALWQGPRVSWVTEVVEHLRLLRERWSSGETRSADGQPRCASRGNEDMSIKSRLRKLEAVAPPAPDPTFTVTEEQRGKIMRAMVVRGLRWPDPFPDIRDQEYFRHFSPWFQELKRSAGQDGRIAG